MISLTLTYDKYIELPKWFNINASKFGRVEIMGTLERYGIKSIDAASERSMEKFCDVEFKSEEDKFRFIMEYM